MKRPSGKIATIILLMLVSLPVCCPFIWSLRQQSVQKQAISRLEKTKLHVIYLNKNEISWAKKGKELIIDGRLFDVKSITQSGNDVFKISGLFDDEETALVKKIRETHQKNNSNNNKEIAQLLHWDLTFPEKELAGIFPAPASTEKFVLIGFALHPHPYIGIPVPPPLA